MFTGPPIDDEAILELLPVPYARLLREVNGYVAFHGGLHVRGACLEPTWHSLRFNWLGDGALWRLYPEALNKDDVPFAEDALGDQYVVRGAIVHRLSAETGDLKSLDLDMPDFDAAVRADPVGFLSLEPLMEFRAEGKSLEPGQLLAVMPPFVINLEPDQRTRMAVASRQHTEWLADFARATRDVPDGGEIQFKVVP